MTGVLAEVQLALEALVSDVEFEVEFSPDAPDPLPPFPAQAETKNTSKGANPFETNEDRLF
jgi:hypothetical protein